DENRPFQESFKLSLEALADQDPHVRVVAISFLTAMAHHFSNGEKNSDGSLGPVDRVLPLIQKLSTDPDPEVRSASQTFLANFVSRKDVVNGIQAALEDQNSSVRAHALSALQTSQELPPLATLEKAFVSARGDIGLGLIELMVEQKDSGLATRLTP